MVPNYENLIINTLGEFIIKKGDKTIFSDQGPKLRKRWRLFFILVFNRGERISDHKLIKKLNLTDSSDPNQALRALIYRLRQDIKNREGNYIFSENGGYMFNAGSPYWLDTEKFDNLIKRAGEENSEEALRYYQQAIELYKGDFLENIELVSKELLSIRQEYRKKFVEIIKSAAEIHRRQGDYQEAINLFETGLQVDNINVEFYHRLIQSLKEIKRPDQAVIKAEEAMSIFNNFEVEIPEKLQQEISDLISKENNQSMDEMLADEVEGKEAFECGPLTFSKIVNLERRRNRRKDRDLYLVDFKLMNRRSPSKMIKAERILYKNLLDNLRSYDLLTRLKPREYLLMFVDIDEEELKKVVGRIVEKYNESLPPPDIMLGYEYRKI
ncbi:MAG: AfsR/SARP family transcriptional regulator [Bacillota bacterium]